MAGHRIRASLALAGSVLLVMAVAVPVSADPGSRPFKGLVVGEVAFNEVPVTICAPSDVVLGGLRTDSSAIGTSTHLGKTVVTMSHCTPSGEKFGPGRMVLTSARGDEVWITYSGSAPYSDGDTEIKGNIEFKIDGGTGRFEDAVGGGSMTVHILVQGYPWPAKWVWNGTIGY